MHCLFFCCVFVILLFLKQKTAYGLRISDFSSDVCSSDLHPLFLNIVDRHAMSVVFHDDPAAALDERRLKLDHDITGIGIVGILDELNDSKEERRVGKEWVRSCSSRWSTYHSKTNKVRYITTN